MHAEYANTWHLAISSTYFTGVLWCSVPHLFPVCSPFAEETGQTFDGLRSVELDERDLAVEIGLLLRVEL